AELPIVMVLNRFDEHPEFITHVAYMDGGRLQKSISIKDESAYAELYQLLHLKTSEIDLPGSDPSFQLPQLKPDEPLVRIRDAKIAYGDTIIFENISWTIQAAQHWQLTGPNGSGKTGLLTLITGDHPQCYVNDIFVFGFQRGQGESIWQIKQYIGYVSTALQWEYRVSISVRNVVISGFYDSIGLYSKFTDEQFQIAEQWLQVLGMQHRADEPFNQLSHGDQRLLLIARAMVKHPPLLILDEPCLGLDDMNRQLVLALIEKICAGSNTAVLYVNHHSEDRIRGIEHHLSLGATDQMVPPSEPSSSASS
ncbi:MAG: ATP-binding cassette domain-containing protein, partial [Granulosicoccus sp.]|nr:ATP-binding cassette domain-containing protein [Granulosicoccus sp.]